MPIICGKCGYIVKEIWTIVSYKGIIIITYKCEECGQTYNIKYNL
jgi:uncharacterized Zn finger protein